MLPAPGGEHVATACAAAACSARMSANAPTAPSVASASKVLATVATNADTTADAMPAPGISLKPWPTVSAGNWAGWGQCRHANEDV